MAIRFIDTNFYRSPFVRGLEGALKGLYGFIICDCSAAGIWAEDLEIASIYIGFKIEKSAFEKNFVATGKAIYLGGGKYFFPDFIQHQYPKGLQKNNPAHQNIISELLKFNLIDEGSLKVLESPSKGAISNSNSKGNSEVMVIDKVNINARKEKKPEIKEPASPEFEKYLKWAEKNLPDLLMFKNPLTDNQLHLLLKEFNATLVREKLEAIGNKVNSQKNYKTVYFTCRNWCRIAVDKGWKPSSTPVEGVSNDQWSQAAARIKQKIDGNLQNNLIG